jgi:antirestriction protein ArdC
MDKRKSAYQEAADRIITQLETGTVPWRKPWASVGLPKNLVSHKEYRGINVILLSLAGYPSPWWMTFKQALELGGNVRKGEHGTHIIFWSTYNRKGMRKDEESGEEIEFSVRTGFWRSYCVFNLAQTEGVANALGLNEEPSLVEDLPAAQAIWDNYPNRPNYRETDCAFYRPSEDLIGMPLRTSFKEQREYYSTLFHEMTHSTGAAKRLNRDEVVNGDGFGGQKYSAEELVAEFGSSMLCGVVGISPTVVENQAAYIQNWLNKLRLSDNKTMLLKSISAAQKACDHIRAVKTETEEVKESKHEL